MLTKAKEGDVCPRCSRAVLEDENKRHGYDTVGCPACGSGFFKIKPARVITTDDAKAFCEYYDMWFYNWGHPNNWNDHEFVRAATNNWPSEGVTIPVSVIADWLDHPPFLGENI